MQLTQTKEFNKNYFKTQPHCATTALKVQGERENCVSALPLANTLSSYPFLSAQPKPYLKNEKETCFQATPAGFTLAVVASLGHKEGGKRSSLTFNLPILKYFLRVMPNTIKLSVSDLKLLYELHIGYTIVNEMHTR